MKRKTQTGGSWLVFNPSEDKMDLEENPRRRRRSKKSSGKKRARRRHKKASTMRANPAPRRSRRRHRRNPSHMRAMSPRRSRRRHRRNPSLDVKGLAKGALGGAAAAGVDVLVSKAQVQNPTMMRGLRVASPIALAFAFQLAGADNLAKGAAGVAGFQAVKLGMEEYAYRKTLAATKKTGASSGTSANPASNPAGMGSVRQFNQRTGMGRMGAIASSVKI